jgi:hypothetical protein
MRNARLTKYFTKKKKISYKVMWYNMIEKEMNPNFEKFNHVVPHHFLRVFFFFFDKPSISLSSINTKHWMAIYESRKKYI